jgi:arsenate reductase
MTSWKLYHNPQCSNSREALQMIQAAGVKCEVVEYLKTPPNREEIRRLIRELQGPIAELIRIKDVEFQANPFDVNSEELVAERITSSPRLLERPILWGPQGAVIGRPLERIRKALESSGVKLDDKSC